MLKSLINLMPNFLLSALTMLVNIQKVHFKNFLCLGGIIHQTSCVRTPQQNDIAERKNGPIQAIAHALMLQMHVPKLFWADAILTATYLLNRIPSHILKR